ncbi:hypothetical protein [Pseudomonas oryzihabitans]|uniref:hypothetical protein n=1 Tax=Pseudomonas oryzihabitans TaxID=47885 RepID=UPI0028B167CB|nr:hypothetical protein [Pseudomonas oryzihabitans]
MSRLDRVKAAKATKEKKTAELRAFAEARIGSISASQRQMLSVAASRGAELEPAGPLAGSVSVKKKQNRRGSEAASA